MASATRYPLKSIGFTIALVAGVGASRVNLRALVTKTVTGPGNYSRIAALLLVLLNLKNVPFAWHFRVWNAIFKHLLFSRPNIPPQIAPSTLFLPVITSSHSPLTECDYNMHKSNSTYFSDLDVTRSHLICALLEPGIYKLNRNDEYKLVLDGSGKPVNKRWNIMLGSVMCSFKREIGFYQGFEMWSRILCWDRKWIYIVTHFVKKGAVKPSAYILTDGSWFGGKGYKKVEGNGGSSAEIDEKHIFASAISKYVGKKGRLTVHPEIVMEAAGMLPPKPGGWHTASGSSGESTPPAAVSGDATERAPDGGAHAAAASGEWDWRRVEAENSKGLKYVEHFQALDGLHAEFSGSQGPALGRYRDFLL